MKIGEFFVTLGVDTDAAKVKDLVNSIGELPLKAAAGILALAGIDVELSKIAEAGMEAAVGFENFQNQTGLSWKELQKWQIVAEQAHVPVASLTSSVTALQKQLAEIRLGRGNVSPFQMLGISPTGDAFQVLEQLRRRVRGMDRATATNMIGQMGLSPEMMNLLLLGDAEFRKFGQTVHGLTTQQEKDFLRAKDALTQFAMVAKELGTGVVANLINLFERLFDGLKGVSGMMEVLGGLAIALGAYFFPITAIIAGLLLILDDVSTYLQGGESYTGDFVKGIQMMFKDPILFAQKFLDILEKITAKLTGGEGVRGFFDDITNLPTDVMEALTGGGTEGLRADLFGARQVQQTNTITIHVTGTQPEENARHAKREFDRAVNDASLQTDKNGY